MANETAKPATKSDSITAPDAISEKLPQSVEIKDVGPCKKHVKVTIEETAIRARFDEKYSDLVLNATGAIPGFRPGKAPREIVERKYKKEISQEVKQELLLASLEQLADEQQISPLSPPELDPAGIVVPDKGPFIYEFDIEVRPEFEMPNYKGLKLRRPTHTFTDADVAKASAKMLEPLAEHVVKDGPAAINDILTADLTITKDGKELNKTTGTTIRLTRKLALADGVCEDFGKVMTGVKAGETRTATITLSQKVANPDLRGQAVEAAFHVTKVQSIVLPKMTAEIYNAFGVRSAEQFDELVRSRLDRQLEYLQRQEARKQMFEILAKDTNWDLPQDLLQRQARRTLSRRVMEMRQSGMTDDQIRSRSRMLEMDAMRSTAAALKEHFVLQKISEVEKLEIEDADIDAEIDAIADRTGESPRKVKARLEKDDLIEAVATELLERKAMDLVLESAVYDDYEMNPIDDDADEMGTAEASATSEPAPDEAQA